MTIDRISDWSRENTSVDTLLSEFFLNINISGFMDGIPIKNPNIDAKEPLSEIPTANPITYENRLEQLSPKGLSLISYLYSLKDKDEAQPLIASDLNSLKHIIKLVEAAPVGTQVTVIFQMSDHPDKGVKVHKTVCKFEKYPNALYAYSLDSLPNSGWAETIFDIAKECLTETNANKAKTERSTLFCLRNKLYPKPKELQKGVSINYSRQVDGYQCGVFAEKDARELKRDKDSSSRIASKAPPLYLQQHNDKLEFVETTFDLTARYLKTVQSTEFAKRNLIEHKDELANRKGKTLKEVYQKRGISGGLSGYVQHFGQKFNQSVKDFIHNNIHQLEVIHAAVEKYDAEKMNLERLTKIYGPKNEMKAENIPMFKLAEPPPPQEEVIPYLYIPLTREMIQANFSTEEKAKTMEEQEKIISNRLAEDEKARYYYENAFDVIKAAYELNNTQVDKLVRNFCDKFFNTPNPNSDYRERLQEAGDKCAAEFKSLPLDDFGINMKGLAWKNRSSFPQSFSLLPKNQPSQTTKFEVKSTALQASSFFCKQPEQNASDKTIHDKSSTPAPAKKT